MGGGRVTEVLANIS